ncbi:hypothetical protein [Flavobacterium gyeonganense]|uniref:hypothetical protein n=1 Tax=Flavobacterium gyeonganense TaxID=1310418 RepID=UPI002413E44D|nr:hypothetical protein [Flavobacterium gyeonganense]
MKTHTIHFIVFAGVFSLNCFGQVSQVITNPDVRKTPLKFDDKSKEDLVIESYCVEEVINLATGKKESQHTKSQNSTWLTPTIWDLTTPER